MAASAWTVFNACKKNMGRGTNFPMNFDGTSTLKAVLFQTGVTLTGTVSTLGSLGAFTCTAGGGDEVATLGTITWTGASANDPTKTFNAADIVFTASTQAISSVRYCVIYQSTGASDGRLICYAALSTAAFQVASTNTLTIQLASTGIFTLT